MSEPVLKAIIRLFALVAKEDKITKQERDYINIFLQDHLSQSKVDSYLELFDQCAAEFTSMTDEQEERNVDRICNEINSEVAQKQKAVIFIELMSVIMADDSISEREAVLAKKIGTSFFLSEEEIILMQSFVIGQSPEDFDQESFLIIDSNPSYSGRSKHLNRKSLKGMISILFLKRINIYFFRYLGNSDIYLNGVPQKQDSVHILGTGGTFRWESDSPVYYGDILAKFKNTDNNIRITFEARNIFYEFKNGKLGLRDINLFEESGNLIALMGASGAGKSTLLHVLNGTEKPTSGEILINGVNIHAQPQKIEGIIGFVPQDDLLIEDLTVYQNLYFASKLCFTKKSEEEIDFLVLKTLDDLGLSETKNLKVGSPMKKTISGGQRKRLNIGLELLRKPSVLFCDEPTSGLSSRDSENVIELLKELSLKGKLVFTVIHQPSSDIFKMFDKLVILDTGGYQIYYGNPIDSLTYFKRKINLVNSEQGECIDCGNVNPEQIFNIIETKVINEYGNFTDERKFSPEQWNNFYVANKSASDLKRSPDLLVSSLHIPNRLKQIHLFSWRDLLAKISNQQYLLITLLEAPLLAFILAFIVKFHNIDDPFHAGYVFSKNLNMPAYLFMSVIVALFMGLTVSAEEIIRDRKILKRESFLNLSKSSYIASKILILFLISAIQTLLFVIVGNYYLEIKGLFVTHWFILFSASCFANLLGLNISSAFNSAVTIYILIPVLLIPQLILSGVVVKFDKLNPVIGNTATVPFIGDLMTSRWAFEAGMVAQYKDNKFEKEFYPFDKIMAESDYKKVYLIPAIESKLDFVRQNISKSEPIVQEETSKNLKVIRNEISNELDEVGHENFISLDKLTLTEFDSSLYAETTHFLETLKKYYVNRYNTAEKEKELKIDGMTNTPEREKEFEQFKDSYQNEAITELVRNVAESHRIIEKDGKFVQKIFPVYKDPDPEHIIDFNAQFYMPKKHFMNLNIDTLYFNMGVIWSMVLIMVVTLYFEVLRKIIDGLGNFSNPLPKRM